MRYIDSGTKNTAPSQAIFRPKRKLIYNQLLKKPLHRLKHIFGSAFAQHALLIKIRIILAHADLANNADILGCVP